MNKISHLGIAVRDLKSASETYRKLLQSEPSEMEFVAEQKVNVVKFTIGESTIELLEGTSADSPISKFIEKRGEGIHHIAYESDDVKTDLKRLDSEGFELINKEPRVGSDNMLIAFVNPKSIGGVLTEVCQH
ncbi:MAG TPA: methylmalonyl-CoA epimerase [Ignavibacteria bacterium]|nr:methylmalonyl-CoA epimerase [Ignavibacteria bacterium]HAX47819.1 methylmalonyl-CoA epimerase [Bacteroidota bacterium]HRE09541.1 methylmalonyl-CoA epimerase [Ignavibacteria bacterium]HRF64439.1 methylmalonyl-CoA epimerase [Ignavibacteria bacterium]HRJ04110.1 methylmalonyl-CoA epimerase [Ignavibacteria bacterium]